MRSLWPILLRHAGWTALALALVLHLLWAVWMPAPRTLRGGAPPRAIPAMRYEAVSSWRELQHARRDDPRLLRSSALFALPTPLGFSGPVLDQDIRYAPAFADAAWSATSSLRRVLVLGQATVAPPWAVPATGRVALAVVQSPVFGAIARQAVNTMEVSWSADFSGALPRLLPVSDLVLADPASWEQSVAVRYDDKGALREAFLDPPGPRPDRNAAVVRLLHTLAPPPGAAGRSGRVVLRYSGPVGPGPAASSLRAAGAAS